MIGVPLLCKVFLGGILSFVFPDFSFFQMFFNLFFWDIFFFKNFQFFSETILILNI